MRPRTFQRAVISLPFIWFFVLSWLPLFKQIEFVRAPQFILGLQGGQDAGQALAWSALVLILLWLPLSKACFEWVLTSILWVSCAAVFFGKREGWTLNGAENSVLILFLGAGARAVSVPIALFAAYLTHQWITFACLVTGLAAWMVRKGRWEGLLMGLAPVSMAATGFAYSRESEHFSDRWEHWKDIWGACQDFLWLGHGGGSFYHAYPYSQIVRNLKLKEVWAIAHNDYLQCVYEYGLIGLVLSLLAIAVVLHLAWHRWNPRAWVASWVLLTGAFFHFPAHDPLIAGAAMGFVGLLLR